MKLCLNCKNEFNNEEWLCPACNYKTFIQNGEIFLSQKPLQREISFDNEYFKELFQVESGSFWFCSRNKLILWALGKYFPYAKSFLEVGCGTGFVLSAIENKFPDINLYGTEYFSDALDFAQSRLKRAKLFQANALQLPFKNEFDIIGAFDVIEHVEQDETAIRAMYEAVKPGGGIILTVPQHKALWSKHDEYAHHRRRYSAKELINKVKLVGFNIITTTSFMTLLLPLLLTFRKNFKGDDIKRDIMSQYKINRFTNAILEKILDFERILIEYSVKFPLGSSLMLIGRKNFK